MLAFLLALTARAASLDNIEVGGPWGTPNATDGTAAWWNPAGIAAGHGTRLFVEGAPTFATVTFDRSEPHSGADTYRLQGVVPYAGFASDLGAFQSVVPGIGLGAGLAVPFVRGGTETPEPGSGRYAMRDGDIKGIVAMGDLGWQYHDVVAVGVGVGVLLSSWRARVDLDTMPDLDKEIEKLGDDPGYTDSDLEGADYTATLDFGELTDTATLWSAGIRVHPHERVSLAVTYISGAAVDNTGAVDVRFGCPPQSDAIGRFGAESLGLCDATVHADAAVAYVLPWRIHGGIQLHLADPVTMEAMGGMVAWSQYSDFHIRLTNVADQNDLSDERAVDLVE